MSEGWYCPGCKTYHAPDVKTCPGVKPVEDTSGSGYTYESPVYDPNWTITGSGSIDNKTNTNWILWN